MRTITNLIQGKRDANMVNVYIDGEYYTNVPIDFVVEYDLKKGKEITDDDLALLEYDKMRSKAYMYILSSVSKRSISEGDMRCKLLDKEYPISMVNEVIAKAKGYNYLDDDYYTRIYIEQNRARKGSLKIKAELKGHHISDALIAKYLVASDEEREGALREATKYASRLNLSDIKDKNKLIRHMQYKGYKWDIVSSVVNEILDGELEE